MKCIVVSALVAFCVVFAYEHYMGNKFSVQVKPAIVR